MSFRKIERTAQGTVLVSSFMRNLICVLKGDSAQSNITTLPVPYRVYVLTCGMTIGLFIINIVLFMTILFLYKPIFI